MKVVNLLHLLASTVPHFEVEVKGNGVEITNSLTKKPVGFIDFETEKLESYPEPEPVDEKVEEPETQSVSGSKMDG